MVDGTDITKNDSGDVLAERSLTNSPPSEPTDFPEDLPELDTPYVERNLRKRGQRWQGRFYVNGRRIEKSLRTTNLRVARQRLRYLIALYGTGQQLFPEDVRIDIGLHFYEQHLLARRTTKSGRCDMGRLRGFVAETHVKTLGEVTPGLVSRFLDGLAARGRSPKTVLEYRNALFGLYRYALEQLNYGPPNPRWANPAAAVKPPRLPAPTIVYLTLPEIERQLAVLKDEPMLRAAAAIMIFAGLRRGEVFWLTLRDVLLDARVPHLQIQAKDVDGQKWQPKTARNRNVPVSTSLMPFLRGHINSLPADAVWLFPNPEGGRWREEHFSAAFRDVQRQHGLRWNCLHFRHSFASHLAQRGVSLYKVAQLMGNSVQICQRHYAHLTTESLAVDVEFWLPRSVAEESGQPPALPLRLVGA